MPVRYPSIAEEYEALLRGPMSRPAYARSRRRVDLSEFLAPTARPPADEEYLAGKSSPSFLEGLLESVKAPFRAETYLGRGDERVGQQPVQFDDRAAMDYLSTAAMGGFNQALGAGLTEVQETAIREASRPRAEPTIASRYRVFDEPAPAPELAAPSRGPRLTPEYLKADGVLERANLALRGRAYEAPSPAELSLEGLQSVGPAIAETAFPEQATPSAFDTSGRLKRVPRTAALAVAEGAATTGLGLATDPSTALGVGAAGRLAALRRAGAAPEAIQGAQEALEGVRRADAVLDAASLPSLGTQTYQDAATAYLAGREKGWTSPDALEAGTRALMGGAMTGAMARGLPGEFAAGARPQDAQAPRQSPSDVAQEYMDRKAAERQAQEAQQAVVAPEGEAPFIPEEQPFTPPAQEGYDVWPFDSPEAVPDLRQTAPAEAVAPPGEPPAPSPALRPGEATANAPEGAQAPVEAIPEQRQDPDLRAAAQRFREDNPEASREQLAEEVRRLRVELDTDPLTGLGSKRRWDRLQAELEATPDPSARFVSGDMRGAKGINDTLGHAAGDDAIKAMGRLWRQHFGEDTFRTKGDEFEGVLRGVPDDDLPARMEAFRQDLRAAKVTVQMPDGRVLDIPTLDAHLGYGRTPQEADLAANAARQRTGSGRQPAAGAPEGPAADALPDQRGPERGVEGSAPAGRQDPAPQLVPPPGVPKGKWQKYLRARTREVEAERPDWRRVPEPPQDAEGNPVTPGTEDWTPAERTAARRHVEAYLRQIELDQKSQPVGARQIVDVRGAGAGSTTGEYLGVTSHKRGTPFEDMPETPAQLRRAWRVDKGNPTEAEMLDLARQDLDSVEGEGGDVSFDPDALDGAPKYATRPAPGQRGLEGIGEDVPTRGAKPKGPEQTSMFSGDMLQGVESRTTEGREAEGPLFTQDADARAKAEKGAQGGIKFAAGEKAPAFYSALQRAVEGPKAPGAGRGLDWQKFLTGQPGVKADELKWTGLDDFLRERAGQRIPKAEVLDFLKQNEVRVEEVTLGGTDNPRAERLRAVAERLDDLERERRQSGGGTVPHARTDQQRQRIAEIDQEAEALQEEAERLRDYAPAPQPKFGQYTLPGGENYRELLLTLPVKIKPGGEKVSEVYKRTFLSSHFDEPNVLAHVRFNERTDADGKRVLFIEELQSDWAQKGRREGFGGRVKPDAELVAKSVPAGYYVVETAGGEFVTNVMPHDLPTAPGTGLSEVDLAIRVARERLQTQRGVGGAHKVPAAPFVGSTEGWLGLAMKRVLRHAAENGFDRVAWTTGEQQAGRYDLSKHIDALQWDKTAKDGLVRVTAFKGNQEVLSKGVRPEELADVVGKELADKINANTRPLGEYSGLALKVGGEGMKGFYDQILPAWANKYGKKWGARVGETTIFGGDAQGGRYSNPRGVHSLDITTSMRESVMEGQPLFRASERGQAATGINAASLRKELGERFDVQDQGGGVISILAPGGRRIALRQAGDGIEYNADAFKKGRGRGISPDEEIVGSWQRIGRGGLIALGKGEGVGTFRHEWYHAAKELTFTQREKDAMYRRYLPDAQAKAKAEGVDLRAMSDAERRSYVEEVEAEAYPTWNPRAVSHSLFQRIRDFFRGLYRSLFPDAESVFGRVRSGEAFRKAEGREGEETRFATLPKRTADTMSDAIALSSPSGSMSKTARARANERLRESLFGKEGLQPEAPRQEPERDNLLRRAKELRDLASRGMSVRKFTKEAERLEAQAASVEEVPTEPKYATAPKQPPDFTAPEEPFDLTKAGPVKKKLTPIPISGAPPKTAVSGRPVQPGEAPRVEQRVESLRQAEKAEGEIPAELDRETKRRWKTIEPEVQKILREYDDAKFFNIMKRRQLDDAEVQAWDSRVRGKEERLEELREKVRAGDPKGEAARDLTAATLDFIAAQRATVNDGTGTARALAARARVMDASRTPDDRFLRQVFKEIPNVTDKQAADIVKAYREDPEALLPMLHTALGRGKLAKALELFKANLLSAWSTDVANFSGNLAEQHIELAETGLAARIDWVLQAKFGGDRARFKGEMGAEWAGSNQALGPAVRRLGQNLKDVFTLKDKPLDINRRIEHQVGAIGGTAGRVVRTSFGKLEAMDQFFKDWGGSGELAKQAYRKAAASMPGAKPAEIAKRADEILKDIADPENADHVELIRNVERSKTRRTFQEQRAGSLTDHVGRVIRDIPVLGFAIPFHRTPGNIAARILERSPWGFVKAKKVYNEFQELQAKHARGEATAAEVAEARGKVADALAPPMLGTALLAAFAAAAQAGLLTGGGPTDDRDRNALRSTGWQPYSVVLPDGQGGKFYIPFNRFEPVSSLLGFAADMVEAKDTKSAGDLFTKALDSFVQNLTNKSYLQGLSNLGRIIGSRDRAGVAEDYVKDLTGAIVPSIVNRAAQAIDPTLRDTRPQRSGAAGFVEGVGKNLASRIPGVSMTLPERRAGTGEPIERPGNAATRFALPAQPSRTKKGSDLEKLLVEIGAVNSAPQRDLKVPGSSAKVRLTTEEYQQLQDADRKATEYLRRVMASDAFRRANPEAQKAYIQRVYGAAGSQAAGRIRQSSDWRKRAREAVAAGQ